MTMVLALPLMILLGICLFTFFVLVGRMVDWRIAGRVFIFLCAAGLFLLVGLATSRPTSISSPVVDQTVVISKERPGDVTKELVVSRSSRDGDSEYSASYSRTHVEPVSHPGRSIAIAPRVEISISRTSPEVPIEQKEIDEKIRLFSNLMEVPSSAQPLIRSYPPKWTQKDHPKDESMRLSFVVKSGPYSTFQECYDEITLKANEILQSELGHGRHPELLDSNHLVHSLFSNIHFEADKFENLEEPMYQAYGKISIDHSTWGAYQRLAFSQANQAKTLITAQIAGAIIGCIFILWLILRLSLGRPTEEYHVAHEATA